MAFLPAVEDGDPGPHHAFVREGLCRLAPRPELVLAPKTQACGRPAAGPLPLGPRVRSVPRRPRKTPGPRRDPVRVPIQQGCGEGGGSTACGRPTETPLNFESRGGHHPRRRYPAPGVLPGPTWTRYG